MKNLFLAFATSLIALAISATTAAAVVVTYNGVDYNVTTKTGNFFDLNQSTVTDGTRLQDQPWWGDDTAARTFAALYGSVGTPYFASSFPIFPVTGCYLTPNPPAVLGNASCTTLDPTLSYEWGIAKPATSPASATGIIVTYNGADYEVTTKTGAFLDLIGPSISDGTGLFDQLWWGDDLAARTFAALYASVGTPFFAISFLFDPVLGCYLTPNPPATLANASCTQLSPLDSYEWAIATPVAAVPVPAGAVLLLTGLGAMTALRRRRGPGRRVTAR